MIYVLTFMLRAAMLLGTLSAATVEYAISDVGVDASGDFVSRYTFLLRGEGLEEGMELDIRFDPAIFRSLSNGAAGSDFDVLLFQPNNPPGSEGVFSALALTDDPDLTAPFSVDFILLAGKTAGALPFLINEYDADGKFVRTAEAGTTTPQSGDPVVPEPATFALAAVCVFGLTAAKMLYR